MDAPITSPNAPIRPQLGTNGDNWERLGTRREHWGRLGTNWERSSRSLLPFFHTCVRYLVFEAKCISVEDIIIPTCP